MCNLDKTEVGMDTVRNGEIKKTARKSFSGQMLSREANYCLLQHGISAQKFRGRNTKCRELFVERVLFAKI